MCLYPRLINNRKYMPNKKNKGQVPECEDERTKIVAVGCGKCIECCKQKARGWQIRLLEELRDNQVANYITLTFNNESLEELRNECLREDENGQYNEIATIAVRRFLERYRKKYKKSLRHWLVTERGTTETERIHLHGFIFEDISDDEIQKYWKYGFINNKGTPSEKAINYVVKYIYKQDVKHKEWEAKILTSSGIGRGYFKRDDYKNNKYKGDKTKEFYITRQGHKIALPIYYRNKIYTEEEREQLWINKLDKGIRWVCGEKISEENETELMQLLEYHRARSKKLGYGDEIKSWDEKKYKNKLKKIKLLKDINKF